MICHSEKFCERNFDTPIDKFKKPYGVWMKAEPRRRHQTIGPKWLRQGGRILTSTPMNETKRNNSRVVTGDDAVGDYNPEKLGMQVDIMIPQNMTSRSENNGMGAVIGETSSNNTAGLVLKNIQAREILELNEASGMEVMDQKRRRVEETKLSGLTEKQNDEDADMTDTQNNGNTVSKNLLKAGAALQARQSL